MEQRLQAALDRHARLTVAVSGGVDSMTLASFARRVLGERVSMMHAASPAVPPAATARVRQLASLEGWALTVFDAGEFADPRYRANPANRCYFCKGNLYGRMTQLAGDDALASGANLDDLGDYRPGLVAATEHSVVHPYIEAEIGKSDIRALAQRLGHHELSELPAAPCLSSRIETGIAIDAVDLAFVNDVEDAVRARLPEMVTIRCRLTANGVLLELGGSPDERWPSAREAAAQLCSDAGRSFLGLRPYRRGGMFVRPNA